MSNNAGAGSARRLHDLLEDLDLGHSAPGSIKAAWIYSLLEYFVSITDTAAAKQRLVDADEMDEMTRRWS